MLGPTGQTVAFANLVSQALRAANDEPDALSPAQMTSLALQVAKATGQDFESLLFDVSARVLDLRSAE